MYYPKVLSGDAMCDSHYINQHVSTHWYTWHGAPTAPIVKHNSHIGFFSIASCLVNSQKNYM